MTHGNARAHGDASELRLKGRVFSGDQLQAPRRPQITMDLLVSKYGLGDNPALRRAFYARLIQICETNGPHAAKLLCDVSKSAQRARDPSRYFCSVAARRLSEAGFDR